MELTRSNIKEYLDNGFRNSNFYNKSKKTNFVETLKIWKTMSINDLDFIEVIKEFFLLLNLNYNSFKTNVSWAPSGRQKAMLETLSIINNDISLHNNGEVKLRHHEDLIHLYDDFYWEIWDYFDDYNNKNEEIVKEEINLILPILEKFLKEYKK